VPEISDSLNLKQQQDGALIAGVLKGGPADLGGIRPGDVMLSVNSYPVKDSSSLLNLIAALKPDESAQITVTRKNQPLSLKIRVGRRPLQRTARPESD